MPYAAPPAGDRVAAGFVEVALDLIERESALDFDLFLHGPSQMVLYRERSQPFTSTMLQRMLDNGIRVLWIKSDDERALGRSLEARMDQILGDPRVSAPQKATALYTASRSLAMDLILEPDAAKLARTRPLVAKTVSAVIGEPRILASLIAALSTRYQLHSHCVNVSVYATAFARHLGYRELSVLTEFALGGMLHDLGKARISESILLKPGPLDEQEWDIMKQHPKWGFDLVQGHDHNLGRAPEAILTHHENWDGQGYPAGLSGADIPEAGRIVAIADSFDALTTQREYREAYTPYAALALMCDEMRGKFDPELLQKFLLVWGPGGALS